LTHQPAAPHSTATKPTSIDHLATKGLTMRLRFLLTLLVLAAAPQSLRAADAVPYVWKSVQIVGGGFVDGIIFHPSVKGLRYARTDMGGAYRWSEEERRWQPILDWVPFADTNLMGVESIALDPNDPDRVYLACGTYSNPAAPDGAILRSSDRGQTFLRTDVPFKFGGNESGRGNGERMKVDPNDGNVLFLGTRHAGVWTSRDGAVSWSRVTSLPETGDDPAATPESFWRGPAGVVFVVIDPRSGAKGKASTTIYAGASITGRPNLFRSTDGGKSWSALAGEPTQYMPTRAVLSADGQLYLSYASIPGPWRMSDGAVWRYDTATGAWTDITPDRPDATRRFGYVAVSVDAHNPGVVIASTFDRPAVNGVGEDIFRSTDRGAHWKPIFGGGGTYDYAAAPYVAPTPIHWLFDIEIDPANSDHAMFTTGYGGWETFDLTAVDRGEPTHWTVMSTGIEETVALALASPTKGVPLISGIGDYGGFVHGNLDQPSPEGASSPPRFGNTTGVAIAEKAPETVVRVGLSAEHRADANISYSLDAGKTWQGTAATPFAGAKLGQVAVSADGAHWIWVPDKAAGYLTTDHGATWVKARGLPPEVRVTADPVDPNRFYGLALFAGTLYVSTDGGATFSEQPLGVAVGRAEPHGDQVWPSKRGDERGGQDRLYAAPGRVGDLWLAAFDGLYHAAKLGEKFQHQDGVGEIHAFGFGKAAPGATTPALYLVGVVNGQRGIFRSDDGARSWVRINDDAHQWGLVLQISGDPKTYGRVYVGTHGRGIFYGDPK